MATIVLGAVGAAVGGSLGGSALGISSVVLGRALGSTVGRIIDQKLMGGGSEVVETGRMDRLRVLGASEGGAVPASYGRMRVAGNVIWASRFKETATVQESGGGKGAPSGPSTKSYSYSVNVAIAVGEGEIARIGRIWADGQIVPSSELNMRVHRGTEDQQPDPVISALEGEENAIAYRGTAYVVFEDLDLGRFGNRVPQMSFEVIRAVEDKVELDTPSMTQLVKGVALIPGTGEYALATSPIYRDAGAGTEAVNINSAEGVPDAVLSLNALNEELPNCEAASLIVSWFGDDLRIGQCAVQPKVENTQTIDTVFSHETTDAGVAHGWAEGLGEAYPWVSGGFVRETAEVIGEIDGRPVYGGTPADGAVIEAIEALHEAGKAVNFYPFLLMEVLPGNTLPDPWSETETSQPVFPWRGRITTEKAPGIAGSTDGTAAARDEVASFFGSVVPGDFAIQGKTVSYSGPDEKSYSRFILHYASLCAAAGGVEAFCIGSEMRAMTQIRDETGGFPAVDALVQLAADVRAILGSGTKIGYAADWSEYFGYRPQDGSGDVYFHLDPLWASNDIDFVGIDNYMPISDWRDGAEHLDASAGAIYNLDYLRSNIEGGEGFDWFYASDADRLAQIRTPIEDGAYGEPWIYRYKDIRSWWAKPHHNRVAGARLVNATAWVPQSKPIWFTELGCAAIDKGTNQPNKFLDPKSSESSVPYFSNGRRDDYVQMQYLRAYFSYFDEPSHNPVSSLYAGPMVDMSRAFVWAWDGRPWPDFPNNTGLWSDGPNYTHGHWLNGRTGVQPLAAVVAHICEASGLQNYDVSQLHGVLRGYSFNDIQSARASLQPLMVTYGFDAIERGGIVVFRNRETASEVSVSSETFVVQDGAEAVASHVRAPEAEVVGQVRLGYVEAEGEFVPRVAEARFPDETVPVSTQNDLQLALTPGEARAISERWLSEARVARDSVKLTLPPSCHSVSAGDVLRLEDETQTSALWRIDRIENREGCSVEAVRMEREVYEPSQEIEELSEIRPFSQALPMEVQFLDLPLLRGTEDPVAPYVAATSKPWPGGAAIYGSFEDTDYQLNTVLEQSATMGVTLSELQAGETGLWDRGVPLTVKLANGSLSSASRSAVLNGANLFAIGDGSTGNWELVQFTTANLVAPATYELSDRLRGQAGSDGNVPDIWPSGSRVIFLTSAVQQLEYDPSLRGLDRHFRVGPAGKSYVDPVYRHYVRRSDGIGLRPYAPCHLRARASGGDLNVSWIRRTRIDGDSWQSVEVPLNEASEAYVVRVLNAGGVLRETEVHAPNWIYTADMRAVDGPVTAIEVAQISQSFGPGPFIRKEFDV